MITLTEIRTNHGSIISFDGHAEDDPEKTCIVFADHRPAIDIALALADGEEVLVDPEDWQVRWTS